MLSTNIGRGREIRFDLRVFEFSSGVFIAFIRFRQAENIGQKIPNGVARRDERYAIPFEVYIEILDEKQSPIDHDLTFTENISRRGSAVRTILDAQIGHYLRINPIGYDLSILAIVRNRRIDEDGVPRLHLEFLDNQFPLERIE